MAASDNLNPRLFHGTGSQVIKGGIITGGEKPAYASDSIPYAESYALTNNQTALFGTVYEVEPLSKVKQDRFDHHIFSNKKGFKIKSAVSYPINFWATPEAYD